MYSDSNPLLPESVSAVARWGQLYGAAAALKIAEAAAANSGPVLVVAEDARAATQVEEELRFFALPGLAVERFADWETLPYDLFSPHPDIVSQRLSLLERLPRLSSGLIVVDAGTLLTRIAPRAFVEAHAFDLGVGLALDLEAFRRRLAAAGYLSVSQVVAPGEFAVRGSLVDLYPMGSPSPYRIDLFDDEIETIRRFDPESQLSADRVPAIRLLPAREFPLNEDGVQAFKRRFRTRFEGDLTRVPIYRDVSNGVAAAGIEYYLPLFFDTTATLFDYLPEHTLACIPQELPALLERAWQDIEDRYEQRRHDVERPVLAPAEICMPPPQLLEACAALRRIEIARAELEPSTQAGPYRNFGARRPPSLRIDARSDTPAAALLAFLEEFDGRVLIAAESAGRREMVIDLLRRRGREPRIASSWHDFADGKGRLAITVSPITAGMLLTHPPLALVAEEQLFGERARQERRRRRPDRDPDAIIRELSDLTIGAPVVHEEYGVGRYCGLVTMDVGGLAGEFLQLEYADGDKLYVPVQSLDLISRYTGAAADHAPLHKLGTDAWQKARRRAAQRIRDTAAELLDVHARRAARPGQSLRATETDLRAFEAAFPFEETPDQQQVIVEVIDDLAATKPMDRVVCGDVGFGKTEVALRAAFVTAQAGRQVAVLVPTTLLAQQHYQTFADRFADWPIRIAQLSRFASGARSTAIIRELERGSIDIVVGTHRLLQTGIRFKDLGLVIVDEEHRFGVKDKERLKQLRAEVDLLTLTATPIPRTLNMAMGGLKDLSLITTPPAARLAIKTFVSEWHGPMVREACLREIRRGGQIYYVHNSVETIEKTARGLAELVPEARIAIGHGQMRERDLEQVMLDFYHGRCNLLVCTTIIESGIDVPAANTIVIDRADRLGLAQLHQLRGRVGRSHHQAYAYLLTPPRNAMTADAVKRLEAIESLEDLGAGFALATHDLEIRGAGELLGEEQSGQIQEIGFALYMDMLERAVAALKAGRIPDLERPLHQGPEIDLHVPALLPEDYIPDVHLRLVLYKRIAGAANQERLRELQVEMIDRFGLLPDAAKHLFRIAALKLTARQLGIRRLDFGPGGGSITFDTDTVIDPAVLIHHVQRHSQTHRFDGPTRVRFRLPLEAVGERFAAADELLEALAGGARPTSVHAAGS